jgi:hypothetical protein
MYFFYNAGVVNRDLRIGSCTGDFNGVVLSSSASENTFAIRAMNIIGRGGMVYPLVSSPPDIEENGV